MSLFTSSHFASVGVSGTDWRDTSKAALEQLESVKTSKDSFNLGFLYISDYLAEDAVSILNLFKSVLGIEHWIGSVGIGVCAVGQGLIDKPAISVMVGYFDPESFCLFPPMSLLDGGEDFQALKFWLDNNETMLVIAHGDPGADEAPEITLQNLDSLTGGFLVGGTSSSRKNHVQFAKKTVKDGISGVAFSQDVHVATTISQGCSPIGNIHTITAGDEQMIRELNGQSALQVFEDDLRVTAEKLRAQRLNVSCSSPSSKEETEIPALVKNIFNGQLYVAFPVPGTDQKDFLVRNILNIGQDEALQVSHMVMKGEKVMFVYRNTETMLEDLSRKLMALRERVIKDTGSFEPKGALYISCVARAFSCKLDNKNDEMNLIQEIIGDIPLTGFYSGGEISNARIYGFTGVLTLFL